MGISLPLWIMVIVAPLGALDIIYYHLWRFRLYDAPSSRLETVTHLVRGSIFAGCAFFLTRYRPDGMWFWVLTALVVADFLNNVVDVISEGPSRAPMGGLPRLEYLVHVVGATSAGALGGAFIATAWQYRLAPTALTPVDHSSFLTMQGYSLAIGGVLMVSFEGALFLRSIVRHGWTKRA